MGYKVSFLLLLILYVVSLECCFLVSATAAADTKSDETTTTTTTTPISCVVSYDSKSKPILLTSNQINDGYCDCIWTGEDEILTSACSGYNTWPGTTLYTTTQSQSEQSDQEQQTATALISTNKLFQCPEENKLQLTVSKINDGICDCCDGADENSSIGSTSTSNNNNNNNNNNNLCTDQCEIIRQATIQERKVIQSKYNEGSKIRINMIKEFKTFIKQSKSDIQVQENKLYQSYDQQKVIQSNIYTLKKDYTTKRINQYTTTTTAATSTTSTLLRQVLKTFQLHELQWFLVYICQLAGEIHNNDVATTDIRTCIPLRLAGFDYGITWEPVTYKLNILNPNNNTSSLQDNEDALVSYSTVVSYNIDQIDTYKKVWNTKMIATRSTGSDTTTGSNKYKNKNNRRRLQDNDFEEYDEPDEIEDDEEDFFDNDDDDTYKDNDSSNKEEQQQNNTDNDNNNDNSEQMKYNLKLMDDITDQPNKEQLIATLTSMSLSQSRKQFVTNANTMVQQLQLIDNEIKEIKQKKQQEDDEEEKEKSKNNESSSESESESETVSDSDNSNTDDDSTVLDTYDSQQQYITNIVTTLEDRSKLIERGINFAISSMVLIDSMLDHFTTHTTVDDTSKANTLINIILSTIHYSKLSSINIYEILLHTIQPEVFVPVSNEDNDETCKSSWADLCNSIYTKTVPINRSGVTIPPQQFIDIVTKFCTEQQHAHSSAGVNDAVCSNTNPTTKPITIESIPKSIGDGYFGYTLVNERDGNDNTELLNTILSQSLLDSDEGFKNQLTDHENELNSIQDDIKTIQSKIKELYDGMGQTTNNKDNNNNTTSTTDNSIVYDAKYKYGVEGELYSIRDKCFNIIAGKYNYVLCLYKGAKQVDADDTNENSHGTNLGKWKKAVYDDTKLQQRRVWKWTNGDKCWNGPERSATVTITCGMEHKLLSASEPDTCRYVFEMESPIGCDDTYKIQNEL